MDLSKYLPLFLSETRERLAAMEKVLTGLDRNPGAPVQAGVDEFFRSAHSIKGMAASMGFNATAALAHALEDLMDPVRGGSVPLTRAIVDLMLAGLDRLRELVDGIESAEGKEKDDASALVTKIRESQASLSGTPDARAAEPTPARPAKAKPEAAAKAGPDAKRDAAAGETAAAPDAVPVDRPPPPVAGPIVSVSVEIAATSRTPAVRGYLVHKRLSELGEIVRMVPSLDDVKRGNFDRKLLIEIAGAPKDDVIRTRVAGIPEVVRVEIRKAGEVTGPAEAKPDVIQVPKPDRFVRIPAGLLDTLIDGVGEILTLRHTLREEAVAVNNPRLLEGVARLERIAQEMHRGALSARLSPIESIVERMPRIAREVARLSGKEVDVDISGGDIEIDRAILEEIHGPLVHVVRNAVDHGLEMPEVRVAAGKPARGRLQIRITREKDYVTIAVSDDGRGMDPNNLRAAAVRKGLLDEARAAELDDREALRLVCMPGFSTAERVTEISGRGVGMDVVKTTVEGFGGEFEIESAVGRGTMILMRLPRTIALVQVLLAHTGEEMYAVPLNKILRSIEVGADEVKAVPRGSAIEVAGELVPMRPLAEALGRPVAHRLTGDLRVRALVVEGRGKKAALAVDEISGVQEVVVKPLGMPLRRIEGVAGITRVGDGRPVFLLDPQKLL